MCKSSTQCAGITAEMLAGVTVRVADAQRMVLRHVGPSTLLVGGVGGRACGCCDVCQLLSGAAAGMAGATWLTCACLPVDGPACSSYLPATPAVFSGGPHT
jgi:hypothetical protein